MKNIVNILIVLLVIGCSSSNNLINREPSLINKEPSLINNEPYLYTIEDANGTKTFVKSHEKGIITEKDFQSLKKYLTVINDYNLDFNKKIIINFIDRDPTKYRKKFQVPWDIFYGNLSDNLNSIEPCNHIWIINKNVKDLYYYHGNKINWIVDKDNIVRELLFKNGVGNGGFIIIKPNGEYFLKIGEYRKSDLLKTLFEFK